MFNELPTHSYEIFVIDDQSVITFDEQQMYYHGFRCFGVATVYAVPPSDLLLPYLHAYIKRAGAAGQNVGILCWRCAVAASKGKPKKKCQHKIRGFTATFSCVDLAYAKRLNYEIHFFEVAIFEKAEKLLEPFITSLMLERLRHTDYPKNGMSEVEKQIHLDVINQEMRFEDILGAGNKLTLQNVKPDPILRKVIKQKTNAFIGMCNI